MKIGTLIINVWCQPKTIFSIDYLQNSMHQSLISVSENIDFTFKRFGFVEATLNWNITLHSFWKNDRIYKNLKINLNQHFTDWKFTLTLTIKEEGE